MIYRVIIEPSAEQEIRESFQWIAEQATPEIAARWLNGLIREIDTLKKMPGRCPLAVESDAFPEEIRELLYGWQNRGKYRILFTISGEAVHVLFIRHTARDELQP